MLLENPKLLLTDKVGLIMLANTIRQSSLSTTTSKKRHLSKLHVREYDFEHFPRPIDRKYIFGNRCRKIPKYMLTYKFGLTILANTIRHSSLSTTFPKEMPSIFQTSNMRGPESWWSMALSCLQCNILVRHLYCFMTSSSYQTIHISKSTSNSTNATFKNMYPCDK